MTIGAELELIPFDAETQRPVPIVSGRGRDSLSIVRDVAHRAGWTEVPAGEDPPSWSQSGGGRLSFEPGGQIELSSAAADSASRLIRDLQCTTQLLASSFERDGILLESAGVDPYNDIGDVPLQLHRPRYERMARYFESIGPSGAKMMRQTASLQINVDSGRRPYERWGLLNALAPYLTAIFANSPVYSGELTHQTSYRAHLWRTLDTTRTGLPIDPGEPVERYLDFALSAGAMMGSDDSRYPTFADWMMTGAPTMEDWELHLTTLFPEIRPRGYFELRSPDSISPQYLAAPIAFATGLIYDGTASRAAAELLSASGAPSLEDAGRTGLRDSTILGRSLELIDLALTGCESIGRAYLSAADLETAAEFFDRYTRHGRTPGDDRI